MVYLLWIVLFQIVGMCKIWTAAYDCYVTRKVIQTGFHGEIHTEVQLPNHSFGPCDLLIIEHFPASIYVDLYQLADKEIFGGPKAYCTTEIDIEAPAYLSKPIDVSFWTRFHLTVDENQDFYMNSSLNIPIHFRYQRPQEGRIIVTLQKPTILIQCLDYPPASLPSGTELSAPCQRNDMTKMCTWKELDCAKNQVKVHTFSLPTAEAHFTTTVIIITIMCTFIASIFFCLMINGHELMLFTNPNLPDDRRACGDTPNPAHLENEDLDDGDLAF